MVEGNSRAAVLVQLLQSVFVIRKRMQPRLCEDKPLRILNLIRRGIYFSDFYRSRRVRRFILPLDSQSRKVLELLVEIIFFL